MPLVENCVCFYTSQGEVDRIAVGRVDAGLTAVVVVLRCEGIKVQTLLHHPELMN